jgi:diadenylate cyclase
MPSGLHTERLAQLQLPEQLRSFLERIVDRPWVTVIELLLVGSVVYTVLRLLQGTPGARLVRAVLTILGVSFAVVYLIAGRFEFDHINVLYPYFILGVFFASLVAFQAELRRILSAVGKGGWLQRWMKTPEETIAPIVTAAARLSKSKIGALIAIERSLEMTPWTESGVTLDAAVSSELLETIFWPGSPLHDLGVVVRQDRLVAAGCQFPLADSADVDRALGSRHRAAIGMSQEADAVVIVVSEETGAISLASDGQLRRRIPPEDLGEVLRRELAAGPRVRERVKHKTGTGLPLEAITADGTSKTA